MLDNRTRVSIAPGVSVQGSTSSVTHGKIPSYKCSTEGKWEENDKHRIRTTIRSTCLDQCLLDVLVDVELGYLSASCHVITGCGEGESMNRKESFRR